MNTVLAASITEVNVDFNPLSTELKNFPVAVPAAAWSRVVSACEIKAPKAALSDILTSNVLPDRGVRTSASEEADTADVVKLDVPEAAFDLVRKLSVRKEASTGSMPFPVRPASIRSLPATASFVTITTCCS
ncbi:hypothetical protein D3C85_1341060 [compost metagenome]